MLSYYGGLDKSPTARVQRGPSERPRVARAQEAHPVIPPLAGGLFSILLEESALLEKVFVYDGSGFGRKLSPFLQQSFDVFPDQV